jgi:UTP:GlnB (protein PII) uridylyltransferase
VGKSLTRSVDADGRIRFLEHEQVGADVASARGHALRLSNTEIERLRTIVRHHMRPTLLAQIGELPTRKAVYHFFRDTGEAGVDVCLLSLADTLATYGPTLPQERWAWKLDLVRHLLESCWERPQEAVSPPALVNGHDFPSKHWTYPQVRTWETSWKPSAKPRLRVWSPLAKKHWSLHATFISSIRGLKNLGCLVFAV